MGEVNCSLIREHPRFVSPRINSNYEAKFRQLEITVSRPILKADPVLRGTLLNANTSFNNSPHPSILFLSFFLFFSFHNLWKFVYIYTFEQYRYIERGTIEGANYNRLIKAANYNDKDDKR